MFLTYILTIAMVLTSIPADCLALRPAAYSHLTTRTEDGQPLKSSASGKTALTQVRADSILDISTSNTNLVHAIIDAVGVNAELYEPAEFYERLYGIPLPEYKRDTIIGALESNPVFIFQMLTEHLLDAGRLEIRSDANVLFHTLDGKRPYFKVEITRPKAIEVLSSQEIRQHAAWYTALQIQIFGDIAQCFQSDRLRLHIEVADRAMGEIFTKYEEVRAGIEREVENSRPRQEEDLERIRTGIIEIDREIRQFCKAIRDIKCSKDIRKKAEAIAQEVSDMSVGSMRQGLRENVDYLEARYKRLEAIVLVDLAELTTGAYFDLFETVLKLKRPRGRQEPMSYSTALSPILRSIMGWYAYLIEAHKIDKEHADKFRGEYLVKNLGIADNQKYWFEQILNAEQVLNQLYETARQAERHFQTEHLLYLSGDRVVIAKRRGELFVFEEEQRVGLSEGALVVAQKDPVDSIHLLSVLRTDLRDNGDDGLNRRLEIIDCEHLIAAGHQFTAAIYTRIEQGAKSVELIDQEPRRSRADLLFVPGQPLSDMVYESHKELYDKLDIATAVVSYEEWLRDCLEQGETPSLQARTLKAAEICKDRIMVRAGMELEITREDANVIEEFRDFCVEAAGLSGADLPPGEIFTRSEVKSQFEEMFAERGILHGRLLEGIGDDIFRNVLDATLFRGIDLDAHLEEQEALEFQSQEFRGYVVDLAAAKLYLAWYQHKKESAEVLEEEQKNIDRLETKLSNVARHTVACAEKIPELKELSIEIPAKKTIGTFLRQLRHSEKAQLALMTGVLVGLILTWIAILIFGKQPAGQSKVHAPADQEEILELIPLEEEPILEILPDFPQLEEAEEGAQVLPHLDEAVTRDMIRMMTNRMYNVPRNLIAGIKDEPQTLETLDGFVAVSDTNTAMQAAIFQASGTIGLGSIADLAATLRPRVRLIVVTRTQYEAFQAWRYLKAKEIPRLEKRLQFIITGENCSAWARDPFIALVNPKTWQCTLIPAKGDAGTGRDAHIGKKIMGADIGWQALFSNGFNDPLLDLQGGDFRSDGKYAYVSKPTISYCCYNLANVKIREENEAIDAIQKLTGKEVIVLDGPDCHNDRYHAPVGKTKYGEHTSLLADPVMTLEIIASLSEEEKQQALEQIWKEITKTPIRTVTRKMIRNFLDVTPEELEKVKRSEVVKMIGEVEEHLKSKGIAVRRIPGIPKELVDNPFGLFYPNVVMDIDPRNRRRSVTVPQYGIARLDETANDAFTDVGFDDIKKFPGVVAALGQGGPRCLMHTIGLPVSAKAALQTDAKKQSSSGLDPIRTALKSMIFSPTISVPMLIDTQAPPLGMPHAARLTATVPTDDVDTAA